MIAEGSYEKKLRYFTASPVGRILGWSHRARIRRAQEILLGDTQRTLLDYGCGDGLFLREVAGQFRHCRGVDIDDFQVSDCRKRLGSIQNVDFSSVADLDADDLSRSFDVITCFEVLEHCGDTQIDAVLQRFDTLLGPTGQLLISVPNETGLSLMVKQIVRRYAAFRRWPDYTERETFELLEFWKMVFAGAKTRVAREVYQRSPDASDYFHGHKGFNWRALRQKLETKFRVRRVIYSPFGWLGSVLSSQVFFVCERRISATVSK